MATLYILNPDLPEQELWFDPASADIIIGSDPSCQVVVNHPTIAPQHTRILTHEGYVWIQDLESGFGTYQLGEALTSVYLEAEKSYHFNIGQVDLVIFLNNNDQAIQQTQPAPENSLRSQLLLRNQQITQPTITPQPVPAANNIQVQQQTADHEDKAKKLQATALKRAQIKKRKKVCLSLVIIMSDQITNKKYIVEKNKNLIVIL